MTGKENVELSNLQKVKIEGPNVNTYSGWFHGWGTRNFTNDDGNGYPVTVALVENENGKIFPVDPQYITFLR